MTVGSTDQVAQVFIVLNPVAGRNVIDAVCATLDRHFDPQAWNCELYETTGAEDVAELVRDAVERGCDMVVAAGGDGTISQSPMVWRIPRYHWEYCRLEPPMCWHKNWVFRSIWMLPVTS